jgi:predicted ester cyclase
VDQATADVLARGYLDWIVTGSDGMLSLFSADFVDHASGRTGLGVFEVVGRWFDESLDERSAELHLVTCTEDRVVLWCTVRGRHIGNGFPRLLGRPVRGNPVTWPQVHVFRFHEGLVVEHWAVRDDAALLDSVGA